MSATTAGAFKAYIETLGLALPVYRDGAPVMAKREPSGRETIVPPPYIVVTDGVGFAQALGGDEGDPDADTSTREQVQVDVFQIARVQTGPTRTRNAEDPALLRRLRVALRGRGAAPYLPTLAHGHRVVGQQRWPIVDNVARTTMTVEVVYSDRILTPTPGGPTP